MTPTANHKPARRGNGAATHTDKAGARSLFEQLGGRPTLSRVHRIFYDKAYAHPWMKQFLAAIEQDFIEEQQTDFMTGNMGGPQIFRGAPPKHAHKHIFISDEAFEMRHELLRESLFEAQVPGDLARRWLRVDKAFKRSMVRNNPSECTQRSAGEKVMVIPKPR